MAVRITLQYLNFETYWGLSIPNPDPYLVVSPIFGLLCVLSHPIAPKSVFTDSALLLKE